MKNKEVIENKKGECCDRKTMIGTIGAIAVVLIIVCIVVGVRSCGKKSNEQELKDNLTAMGKAFYEEFYYPQMEKTQDDVKEYMKKFEKAGIKVNLDNISKISAVDKKLVESMVNSETKKECDGAKTSVRITPKSPYGKTDYDIEITLECGFNSEK